LGDKENRKSQPGNRQGSLDAGMSAADYDAVIIH
jgi:hypothetical protein